MSRPPGDALTVVIVAFNCRALIGPCLASVLAQEVDRPLRVVVVDNASTDETAAVVREQFPQVQTISASSNEGFARGCNRGIRAAGAGPVLLLNPDTRLPPGSLATTLAVLESQATAGIVGCKLIRADGTLDHACKRAFPTALGAALYLSRVAPRVPWLRRRVNYLRPSEAPEISEEVDAVNGAFMLIRHEALVDIGLLDESYWLYGEDLDFCKRAWLHGWSVYYSAEATVTHLKGAVSGSPRRLKPNYWFHKAMWKFLMAHQRPAVPVVPLAFAAIWARFVIAMTTSAVVRSARRLRRQHRR